MRPGFSHFLKRNPLEEGKHFVFLPEIYEDGTKILVPLSVEALYAIGVVLENCMKNGEKVGWCGWDYYLTSPRDRLVVLCDERDEMHVFMHAHNRSKQGRFWIDVCVGKQHDAPVEKYHPAIFDFIRRNNWIFDEHCNYYVVDRSRANRKQLHTLRAYEKTLVMLAAFREEPVRTVLPREIRVGATTDLIM